MPPPEPEQEPIAPVVGFGEVRLALNDEEDLDVNAQEAFDVLIRELNEAIEDARSSVFQATKENRFSEVRTQAERAESIRLQLQELLLIRSRWGELVMKQKEPVQPTGDVSQDSGSKAKDRTVRRSRPSNGHRQTPQIAFRIPILQALIELGGTGHPEEVLKIVERAMADQLNAFDRENLDSGEVRWRKSALWQRHTMKDEGLIKQNSPRGIWEISEKGRDYLNRHG